MARGALKKEFVLPLEEKCAQCKQKNIYNDTGAAVQGKKYLMNSFGAMTISLKDNGQSGHICLSPLRTLFVLNHPGLLSSDYTKWTAGGAIVTVTAAFIKTRKHGKKSDRPMEEGANCTFLSVTFVNINFWVCFLIFFFEWMNEMLAL